MGKLSLKERLQSVCESLIDYDWKKNGLPIMDAMEAWMKVASKTTTPVPELNVAGTRCVSQKKQAALAGAVCLRGVKVTVRRVTS